MQHSLFHRLQKDGGKALKISGAKQGFEFDYAPFIEKMANRFDDPFPIFMLDFDTVETLRQRHEQVMANTGLDIQAKWSAKDKLVISQLVLEDRFKSHLPARRFGIEIKLADKTMALFVEAVKETSADGTHDVPYTAEECAGKTIVDCNILRIYSFVCKTKDLAGSETPEIVLSSKSSQLNIAQCLEGGHFGKGLTLNDLPSATFRLTKAPFLYAQTKQIDWRDIFHVEDINFYVDNIYKTLPPLLNLLWVLEREPKLLIKQTAEYRDENRLRRSRKQTTYDPVHTITVDRQELRRVEAHQAAGEIAKSLGEKGSYQIPGLVLVREYTKGSGQLIEAYARCADEAVRGKATRLLRNKDYAGLETLVREFGSASTKAHFSGVSEVHALKVVDIG